MKVFLSHPMHGIPESEVMELRADMQKALSALYNEEIELIDNYHHEDVPENAGRLWHLGTSIRMMEQADAVYFCGEWSRSKGCWVESQICDSYDIRVLNKEIKEKIFDREIIKLMNDEGDRDGIVKGLKKMIFG